MFEMLNETFGPVDRFRYWTLTFSIHQKSWKSDYQTFWPLKDFRCIHLDSTILNLILSLMYTFAVYLIVLPIFRHQPRWETSYQPWTDLNHRVLVYITPWHKVSADWYALLVTFSLHTTYHVFSTKCQFIFNTPW